MLPDRIRIHRCYSNGIIGKRWAVWRVTAITDGVVTYKVVAGENRRKSFECLLDEFAGKVRYEVVLTDSEWLRVGDD